MGRKWLGYTDEQIMRLTPRQFVAQMRVHEDITIKMRGAGDPNTADSPAGFIDQIPGW